MNPTVRNRFPDGTDIECEKSVRNPDALFAFYGNAGKNRTASTPEPSSVGPFFVPRQNFERKTGAGTIPVI